MLLWIKGSLTPQQMRDKILQSDSAWNKKLTEWLENCHSGDFLTGTHAEVTESIEKIREKSDYSDPTQTLPVPPPEKCNKNHNEIDHKDCKKCKEEVVWKNNYNSTVDDLLLRSNVHNCFRGINKDGSTKKDKASGSCMNNRWGKCKARFPRPTFLKTLIDETGFINMKKIEAWLNTFTPLVTYIFRCNTDVTSLSSGTAIKAVVLYVLDYITKTSLKTHTIFDAIKSVFHRNSEMIGGSLPTKEKARRFIAKIANLLSAKAEMGAPMICMYLLGNPDHYTSHTFVPFYWQTYVAEVRQQIDVHSAEQPQKIALFRKKGKIVGLSPVYDYLYCAPELDHVNLFDWIRCYKREKLPKRKQKTTIEDESFTDSDCEGDADLSFQTISTTVSNQLNKASGKSKNIFYFQKDHPLYETHAMHFIPDNSCHIPNFSGANLSRCDQGDREYYYSSMLTIFKPW